MSCKKIELFPEITCTPKCSIGRLPVMLTPRCDTTDLIGLYDFVSEDLMQDWDVSVFDKNGPISSEDSDKCWGVAGDVSAKDSQFVSFIAASHTRQGTRAWIKYPLPCSMDGNTSEGGSTTLKSGAVSFAQAPIRSISVPTFVPRAGGGGKTVVEEVSSGSGFFIGKYRGSDAVELYYTNPNGNLKSSGVVVKARRLS